MADPNRTPNTPSRDDDRDLEQRDRSRGERERSSVADDRGEGIRRRHETDDEPALEDEALDTDDGIEDEGLGRSDR